MSEKISVIVPLYNAEKTLDRCIKSIIEQTYANLELLLIDDGSTDKSSQICSSWVRQDDRVKYFRQKNAGAAAARNYGLSQMTGAYFAFVDSDDWLSKTFCEKMYNAMVNKNADIVFCDYFDLPENIAWGENEIYQRYKHCDVKLFEILNNSCFRINPIYFLNGIAGVVWRCLYRSSSLSQCQFEVNYRIYEDLLYIAGASYLSGRKAYVHECLYYHIAPENNIKKYYGSDIGHLMCNVGYELKMISDSTEQSTQGKAILYFFYHLAIDWIITASSDYRGDLKIFLEESAVQKMCSEENYLCYKQIFGINGFKQKIGMFLIKKKWFFIYYLIKKLK